MKVTNRLIETMAAKAFSIGYRFHYDSKTNKVVINGTSYIVAYGYAILMGK